MVGKHFAQLCCLVAYALMLSACATVGPVAISNGRSPYNDIIQSTASQQTLLNVVRSHNSETPQFLDVAEVDELTTAGGSINGGSSNLGVGAIGAIAGTGSYQESPTVRYIPLSGQALIAQVSTPVTVESITNLVNSDWDLGAVLTLGVDRITPGYLEYEAAVNALIDLDRYGAIIVAATQSTESEASGKSKGLMISSPGAKDTLSVYFKAQDPAVGQAFCDTGDSSRPLSAKKIVSALWQRLEGIYGVKGKNALTIKSKGSPYVSTKKDGAPLFATRSAIGILKNATEDESPAVAFLEETEVRNLIDTHKRGPCADGFYILDPRSSKPSDFQTKKDPRLEQSTEEYIAKYLDEHSRSHVTLFPQVTQLTYPQLQLEQSLSNARRYMLVAMSPTPPADAYTSVRRGNTWYSILDGDQISKRTLALINQFDTIQATPSTAPLTPTIQVGSK